MGWLNLGSLVLGIFAWILPVMNLMGFRKSSKKNWAIISILSMGACAISLYLQIYYSYYLVKIEDWSALMDTSGAVALVAATLLIVTIILNMMTWWVYRKR